MENEETKPAEEVNGDEGMVEETKYTPEDEDKDEE